MNEEIIQISMQIILHAGDARLFVKEALDAIASGDFIQAKVSMKKADEEIREAHRVQTDAIQGEARGESRGYSLLLTHAQDTLMTVYSEINIAKQMIKVFEFYETRLAALENK